MPCSSAKARHLLRNGKAKVVRTEPFTIQLLYGSAGYKQPITLGVDAGSKHIGLSATTDKKELYASEVELRRDITKNIATRKANRKNRRSRKTRYRKAKFLNRVHSKKKGWLAPSVENKIHTHIKVIKQLHRILPITKIIVETASFDLHKLQNNTVSGNSYQHGEQYGFSNVREFVLWRDNYTCQHCHGKSKDAILNVHHIESRLTGGNAPNNLITLCRECHEKYHRSEISLNIKRGKPLRDATFMGIMRKTFFTRLQNEYPFVEETYGYITKSVRINTGFIKTHCIDAFCISGNVSAEPLSYYYYQKQVRKRNRQIHKAKITKGHKRKMNQAPKYVKGFQLFDKVKFNKKSYYIFGRRQSGLFDIRDLSGNKVQNGSITFRKLQKIENRKGILIEKRSRPILKKEEVIKKNVN